MSIRLYYDQWPTYNDRIIEIARGMTDEQLAIRPAPSRWPVWATFAHTAGMRVYWLCGFLGEPGAQERRDHGALDRGHTGHGCCPRSRRSRISLGLCAACRTGPGLVGL